MVNTNTFYRRPDNFQIFSNIGLTFLIALSRRKHALFCAAQLAFEAAHGVTPKRAREKSKEMIGGIHSAALREAMLAVVSVLGK